MLHTAALRQALLARPAKPGPKAMQAATILPCQVKPLRLDRLRPAQMREKNAIAPPDTSPKPVSQRIGPAPAIPLPSNLLQPKSESHQAGNFMSYGVFGDTGMAPNRDCLTLNTAFRRSEQHIFSIIRLSYFSIFFKHFPSYGCHKSRTKPQNLTKN
jgi:hypothetical protein